MKDSARNDTHSNIFETMWSDWQDAASGAAGWPNSDWVNTLVEINAEIASFVSDRLREDMRMQAEVLNCTNPVELREIQGRFLKTAFEQYSAKTGDLVRLNQAALSSFMGRSSSA